MQTGIGFDVGGQSAKGVLVDENGFVLAKTRVATGRETTPQSLATSLRQSLRQLSTASSASTLGLGVAGFFDQQGRLEGSPNLPLLVGQELLAPLERALGLKVLGDNDAHCAAIAEGWKGAASGCSDYLMVALGTGFGSALVSAGQLYRGTTGFGCEVGHTVVERGGRLCGCGNQGCLEAYVSEVAIREQVGEIGGTLKAQLMEGEPQKSGWSKPLFDLAGAGDKAALGLVEQMVETLGAGLGNAVNCFDVATIVVGGGLASGVLRHPESLRRGLATSLFARRCEEVHVLEALCGPWAGAIGAARLAMTSPAPT